MAHFAEISPTKEVLRVLVVPDEQEHRGHDYMSKDLGLGGTWIQCSYNNRIRKQFPGKGYHYIADADVFVAPRPYPSWSLDENYDWKAPVPRPDDNENNYEWNEEGTNWVLVENGTA